MKNGLRGTYHSVSTKHLQGYLNEFAWRYNHRDDRSAMFLTLVLRSAQNHEALRSERFTKERRRRREREYYGYESDDEFK